MRATAEATVSRQQLQPHRTRSGCQCGIVARCLRVPLGFGDRVGRRGTLDVGEIKSRWPKLRTASGLKFPRRLLSVPVPQTQSLSNTMCPSETVVVFCQATVVCVAASQVPCKISCSNTWLPQNSSKLRSRLQRAGSCEVWSEGSWKL